MEFETRMQACHDRSPVSGCAGTLTTDAARYFRNEGGGTMKASGKIAMVPGAGSEIGTDGARAVAVPANVSDLTSVCALFEITRQTL